MAFIGGKIQKYIAKGRVPLKRSMPTGDLFLTKMLNNEMYRTVITMFNPNGSVSGVVTGFCEGPFAFEGKADWKPIADLSGAEDAASAIYAAKGAVQSALNPESMSNEDLSQLSFKQIRGTELRYAGSGNPIFQMKLILPSYDAAARQSPTDAVRLLMKSVYPEYTDTKYAGKMLRAPLGYGIKGGSNQAEDTPVGTCTITRGKFFEMDQAVIHSVSSTFSQECMEDGYPLYVEVNIQFGYWRTPSYDTAMSWFKI